jgi:geranylgeranyl diphosphate synthase type I
MITSVKDYLNNSKEEIEKEISTVLRVWQREIKESNRKLLPIIQVLIDGMSGGKRIRGILVKLGYNLISQKHPPEIITAAVAHEIFQTAFLIHDDIIDKSVLRRGQKSAYYRLGNNHYGISQAICLGDLGFFLALKLVSSTEFPTAYKNRAMQSFVTAAHETALGQILDVRETHFKKSVSEKDILDIYRNKTAQYTIIEPLKLGAILAGANEKILSKIELFGENLGIAFQIQDDILGVFGDEQTVGKSVSSDIKEGKTTLLLVQARKKANLKQMDILDKLYGRDKITENDFHKIKKVFIKTGALSYTKRRVMEYTEKAKIIIPKLGSDKGAQTILRELADYLISRKN